MKKFFKWTGITIAGLAVILFAGFKFMQSQTKKHSPEAIVDYSKDGKNISVFYCRPSKKDREIFGGLIPYGKVWRTGANEATTFTTNKDLVIDGKKLPQGKYTLWTIPEKDQWTVIWNKKEYGWGVQMNGEAAREPEADELQVTVPVEALENPVEQLTISITETPSTALELMWDKAKVSIPIQ